MQFCSLPLCALLFLILTFTTEHTLAFTPVTVRLNQTATLPCKYTCSGLAKWTLFQSRNALAQCDRTSCRSDEGYEMSHDQYLKGNLSLTIPAADYSKRNMYSCVCNGTDIRDVRLIIETLMSSVELNPGKPLVMDLPIPDPVEVIYKPKDSAGSYGEQICTVTEHTLQCKPEYTLRASLSYTNITLRDVNMSDSGSYTIRDTENNEVIHIYTLFIKEIQMISERQQSHLLVWLLPVLILICIIVSGFFCLKFWERKKQEELQPKCADSLEHLKSLENLLHQLEKNEADNTRQQRAYSDTDLARILHKEDLKMFIEQYRAREIHQHGKNLTFSREIARYELPQRSYSDSVQACKKLKPVSVKKYVGKTEPVKSQQGACTDKDVGEVTIQMEELSSLLSKRTKLEQ